MQARNVYPGPSSQVSDTRDLFAFVPELIGTDSVNTGYPPLTWDKIAEQVFYDYREAWERLGVDG